jgi:hypothetical protein
MKSILARSLLEATIYNRHAVCTCVRVRKHNGNCGCACGFAWRSTAHAR